MPVLIQRTLQSQSVRPEFSLKKTISNACRCMHLCRCVDSNTKLEEFTISGIESASQRVSGQGHFWDRCQWDSECLWDNKTEGKAEATIFNLSQDINPMVFNAEEFKKDDTEMLTRKHWITVMNAENVLRDAREWLDDHKQATLRELEDKKRMLERLVRM